MQVRSAAALRLTRTCHCAQNTAEVRPCAWPRGAGIVPGSALRLAVVHCASCAYALLLAAINFWLGSAAFGAVLSPASLSVWGLFSTSK